MALVKVRFKNGEIKEISDHLAYRPELQKAQEFVVIDDNGDEVQQTEQVEQPQKKIVSVAELAEVGEKEAVIIEPEVKKEEIEIVNPLEETATISNDEVTEKPKRGRKPKV